MNKKQIIAVFVTGILVAGVSLCAVGRVRYMRTPIKRPPRTSYEQRIAQYKKSFGREACIVERRYSPKEITTQQTVLLAVILVSFVCSAVLVFSLRDKRK